MESALAVDIGGTHTKVAQVNPRGEVVSATKLPTDLDGGAEAFVQRVTDAAAEVISGNGVVGGVGLSVAGFVDSARTSITYNPNLRALEGFPLRSAFAQRFGVPAVLDVDSNAACLAEYHFGAGRGARRLLCLVLGTGFGGAMMIDGELVRFSAEAIGDPGHVIVEPGGPLCSCGGRGCAEALVSAPAIAAAAGGGRAFADVVRLAGEGEAHSVQVLRQAGYWLGIAMATLAAIFLPDRIVVAGGVAEAGDLLIEPAREAFRSSAGAILQRDLSISKALLGWRAPLIGAVCPLLIPNGQGACS
ncbi:MAG: ROK family protein [Bryobacterales bacterium]|nr:ROK family protein [Bryobacterales bacterium]